MLRNSSLIEPDSNSNNKGYHEFSGNDALHEVVIDSPVSEITAFKNQTIIGYGAQQSIQTKNPDFLTVLPIEILINIVDQFTGLIANARVVVDEKEEKDKNREDIVITLDHLEKLVNTLTAFCCTSKRLMTVVYKPDTLESLRLFNKLRKYNSDKPGQLSAFFSKKTPEHSFRLNYVWNTLNGISTGAIGITLFMVGQGFIDGFDDQITVSGSAIATGTSMGLLGCFGYNIAQSFMARGWFGNEYFFQLFANNFLPCIISGSMGGIVTSTIGCIKHIDHSSDGHTTVWYDCAPQFGTMLGVTPVLSGFAALLTAQGLLKNKEKVTAYETKAMKIHAKMKAELRSTVKK